MQDKPDRLDGACFQYSTFAITRYCLRQAIRAAGRSCIGKAARGPDVAYNSTSGLHDRFIARNADREVLTLNSLLGLEGNHS